MDSNELYLIIGYILILKNDIKLIGVYSYDDLLKYVPENGLNYYNEQEAWSSLGVTRSREMSVVLI